MKIIIVGGGTTGWSAAASLSLVKNASIIVIEPKDIPIIGGGESTIPHLNMFHAQCKLPFNDMNWLNEVTGTMKLGIEFDNFFEKDSSWFHPFISLSHLHRDYAALDELIKNPNQNEYEFVMNNFQHGKMIKSGYIECTDSHIKGNSVAYHIDAVKYSSLLKRECLKRNNITLIDSYVVDCEVEKNSVKTLLLNDGTKISADLIIDCTGFNSIFANKMDNPWVSFSDRLIVDAAIVVQLDYTDKEKQLKNYTYCRGMNAGWSWRIPLQNRLGFGYNYASRYVDDAEAEREFKNHLVEYYGYDPNNINFRKIKYLPGIRKEFWKGNVVCMGLSCFFVEPIEATAITTTQKMINHLKQLLDADHIKIENKKKQFNNILSQAVVAITEYIELHYSLTKRDDTEFWKYYKNKPKSKIQKNIMRKYSTREFTDADIKPLLPYHNIFNYGSWAFQFAAANVELEK